jgi:hypothetical protein
MSDKNKPLDSYLSVWAYAQLQKWRREAKKDWNDYPATDDLNEVDYRDLKRELPIVFKEVNGIDD